jgi:hypothetical protein
VGASAAWATRPVVLAAVAVESMAEASVGAPAAALSVLPTLAKPAGPPPPPQAARRETLDIRDTSKARLESGILGVIVILRTDEIRLRRKTASLEPCLSE